MWLMFALLGTAAAIMVFDMFEVNNANISEDGTEEQDDGDDDLVMAIDPLDDSSHAQPEEVSNSETDLGIEEGDDQHQGSSEELRGPEVDEGYAENGSDTYAALERYIVDSIPDYREEVDKILWHVDLSTIEDIDHSELTVSTRVVYPEIATVEFQGILIAHIERDAYGF